MVDGLAEDLRCRLGFSNALLEFDLVTDRERLVTDGGLETMIILSLFTNRRSPKDPGNARGGFWGGDFGSLLWTLEGKKITADLVREAKGFSEDALAWIAGDGVGTVEVVATPLASTVRIHVSVTRPDDAAPQWFGPWSLLGKRLDNAA